MERLSQQPESLDGPPARLPLRPALRPEGETTGSSYSGAAKAVSISEPSLASSGLSTPDEPSRIKQFNAGLAKRIHGRPSMSPTTASSRTSLLAQSNGEEPPATHAANEHEGSRRRHHHHHHHHDNLLSQVAEWLESEKAKRTARKSKKRGTEEECDEEEGLPKSSRVRSLSGSSNSSTIGLEKLQKILVENMSALGLDHMPHGLTSMLPRHSRRRSTARLFRSQSSDTEYQDGDHTVPSCDVALDNSKTMSYSAGSAHETITLSSSKRAEKERKAWLQFKNEIVRLAHTLRLKGWRRVPLERGGDIEVTRLSGALTNAVYVVSPPADLLAPATSGAEVPKSHSAKPPPKLLLRIYGPQVEHLIDRENELEILKRLAKKRIGPRMLGTFLNGRFEEFFNAQTLTSEDLRIPDTSKQIAKRMRELHDGVELLDEEKEEGPFVWRNWDKWVSKCQEISSYLDKQILAEGLEGINLEGETWRERGLVCGVEWLVFRSAVEKYRQWLDTHYGGAEGIERKLVFAHNDTQYGNILRLVPEAHAVGTAPSPLLLPANQHKQLIVIDFEYASANTPGLEFANHFTEWCYNYHNPAPASWQINTAAYPTPEEQRRFVRSYVLHRPQYNSGVSASSTPKMEGTEAPKGSISAFMLDSRTPGGKLDYFEEEQMRETETNKEVERILEEVRIWRIANSAQWVAWGIVQANIPEMEEASVKTSEGVDDEPDGEVLDGAVKENGAGMVESEADEQMVEIGKEEKVEEEEEEFDYLGYAQQRALFFWGDIVSLGIMKREELPRALVDRLKIVEY